MILTISDLSNKSCLFKLLCDIVHQPRHEVGFNICNKKNAIRNTLQFQSSARCFRTAVLNDMTSVKLTIISKIQISGKQFEGGGKALKPQ